MLCKGYGIVWIEVYVEAYLLKAQLGIITEVQVATFLF